MTLPEHPFYDLQNDLPILPIAHRGGNLPGPEQENTFAVFNAAYDAGVRYFETDVVATSDKVVLALHGAKTSGQARQTGQPRRKDIESLTFAEVQQTVRIGGEPVPRLEELLDNQAFPDARFYIDPKTWWSTFPLARAIQATESAGRVSIGAFNFGRTTQVRFEVEKRRYLTDEFQGRVATTIGMTGSLALVVAAKGVPFTKSHIRQAGATQFALPHEKIMPNHVEMAHSLGMRMIGWTVNETHDIRRMKMLGVDGVMSDNTAALAEIVDGTFF